MQNMLSSEDEREHMSSLQTLMNIPKEAQFTAMVNNPTLFASIKTCVASLINRGVLPERLKQQGLSDEIIYVGLTQATQVNHMSIAAHPFNSPPLIAPSAQNPHQREQRHGHLVANTTAPQPITNEAPTSSINTKITYANSSSSSCSEPIVIRQNGDCNNPVARTISLSSQTVHEPQFEPPRPLIDKKKFLAEDLNTKYIIEDSSDDEEEKEASFSKKVALDQLQQKEDEIKEFARRIKAAEDKKRKLFASTNSSSSSVSSSCCTPSSSTENMFDGIVLLNGKENEELDSEKQSLLHLLEKERQEKLLMQEKLQNLQEENERKLRLEKDAAENEAIRLRISQLEKKNKEKERAEKERLHNLPIKRRQELESIITTLTSSITSDQSSLSNIEKTLLTLKSKSDTNKEILKHEISRSQFKLVENKKNIADLSQQIEQLKKAGKVILEGITSMEVKLSRGDDEFTPEIKKLWLKKSELSKRLEENNLTVKKTRDELEQLKQLKRKSPASSSSQLDKKAKLNNSREDGFISFGAEPEPVPELSIAEKIEGIDLPLDEEIEDEFFGFVDVEKIFLVSDLKFDECHYSDEEEMLTTSEEELYGDFLAFRLNRSEKLVSLNPSITPPLKNGSPSLASSSFNLNSLSHFKVIDLLNGGGAYKVDPFVSLCVFETQGGICNDVGCKSQHFRDILSDDRETVINELIKLLHSLLSEKFGNQAPSQIELINTKIDLFKKMNRNPDDFVSFLIEKVRSYADGIYDVLKLSESASLDKFARFQENDGVDEDLELANLIDFPVVMLEVMKRLLSPASQTEKKSSTRYFEEESEEQDYEAKTQTHPQDIDLWISYALSVFPTSSQQVPDASTLNKSMNILCKGLQQNRSSSRLWKIYLEFYLRRGKADDVRNLFLQSLSEGFCPDSNDIWWRFFVWEKGVDNGKAMEVLKGFLGRKLKSEDVQSRTLTEIILQIVKLTHEHHTEAVGLFFGLLTTKTRSSFLQLLSHRPDVSEYAIPDYPLAATYLYSILNNDDLICLWMTFLYLFDKKHFPSLQFKKFPIDFKIETTVFKPSKWNCDSQELRNYCFKWLYDGLVGEEKNFIASCIDDKRVFGDQELIDADFGLMVFASHLFEENELLKTLLNHLLSPNTPPDLKKVFYWNRFAKLCFQVKDYKNMLLAFINCARMCFGFELYNSLPSFSQLQKIFDETFQMYEKLLNLPSSSLDDLGSVNPFLKIPSLVTFNSEKGFLWMNYLLMKSIRVEKCGSSAVNKCDMNSFMDMLSIFTGFGEVGVFDKELVKYYSGKPVGEKKFFEIFHASLTKCNLDVLMRKQADDFVSPLNYRAQHRLLNLIVETVASSDGLFDFLESLKGTGLISAKIILLFYRNAKYNEGRRMLVDAIKTTPNDPLLWKLAAKLEKLGVLNAHSRRISRKYLIKQAGLFFGRRFIDDLFGKILTNIF